MATSVACGPPSPVGEGVGGEVNRRDGILQERLSADAARIPIKSNPRLRSASFAISSHEGIPYMFESLQQRLDEVFGRLSRKGKLTEKDVTDAMREVRQALLEADVNFKLVKQFVARVQERAIGADVLESLSPAQQVISIVYDELVKMLGGEDGANASKITFAGSPPTIIL